MATTRRKRKKLHVWGLKGAGWTAKDERMYGHIKTSCVRKRGRSSTARKTCERIAAATVNARRATKRSR